MAEDRPDNRRRRSTQSWASVRKTVLRNGGALPARINQRLAQFEINATCAAKGLLLALYVPLDSLQCKGARQFSQLVEK